mgnify:CR=1 FL=1|tara:strand:+ start:595 stop:849 length:255 start_codon:yes stop_codon:yes gene_type:complete
MGALKAKPKATTLVSTSRLCRISLAIFLLKEHVATLVDEVERAETSSPQEDFDLVNEKFDRVVRATQQLADLNCELLIDLGINH